MASSSAPILPQNWKYKQILNVIPWYASPPTQLVIVSFVCFLCPGMFNALSGMGGGGNIDQRPANAANTALYSTFAVVGFFAGTFVNLFGLRATLSIGGIGYSIYIASFLSYSHDKNYGFTIFAGALLGVCAGLLWTAQGTIMMSYPAEQSKGRYISWFWMIFNLGAVIGSVIPLGQNIHATTKVTVSDGTYVGFLVLTLLGAALAFTLVDAKDIIRQDGSKVIVMKHPTVASEFMALFQLFRSDPYILFLFPMFFASNFFYGYQFNDVNGRKFNTRTSALNNILYWSMQIFGAFFFGYALDYHRLARHIKARVAWVALFALTMAVWGGGYAFQKIYTRQEVDPALNPDPPIFDWSSTGYVGPMFLYMSFGFYDAAFQTCCYWYIGALTNNSRKLAAYAGYYKSFQSIGAAVIWGLNNRNISYMGLLAACWALLAGAMIAALPLIWSRIQDTVPIEQDISFSDETVAEVEAKVVPLLPEHANSS